MAEWREALRGYILPLEIAFLVAAVVMLGVVMVGRRRQPSVLPSPHAWVLGTMLVVSGFVALGSRLWILATAMALFTIALALAVQPSRAPDPTEE